MTLPHLSVLTMTVLALGYTVYGRFITRGPDNALWFTTRGIGRMTTNGQSRIFPVDGSPNDITTGPDGALWFTPLGGNTAGAGVEFTIGRMTTDGVVSTFAARDSAPLPLQITRGPEDNLWFTTVDGGIWRINVAGSMQEILPLDADCAAFGIAVGADGRIWFTQQVANQIGRLESLAFDALDVAGGVVLGLAHGADDSVWFADAGRDRIGRIGPDGSFVQYELGRGRTPTAVAVGPDGSAWFTNQASDTIGHVTTEGEVVEFPIPTAESSPSGIAAGWDGHLYFTEVNAGRVARITTAGVVTNSVRRTRSRSRSTLRSVQTAPCGSPRATPIGSVASRATDASPSSLSRRTTRGRAASSVAATAACTSPS